MLIAKVQNNQIISVDDHFTFFPNTSFPSSGISEEFLNENGYLTVSEFKPYDKSSQKLVAADPYIEDNKVYTVTVEQLSEQELTELNNVNKQLIKEAAMTLLQETDWVEYPSVSDQSNTPHLLNYQHFIDYRLSLRSIAVNPPISIDSWPIKPEEQWSL